MDLGIMSPDSLRAQESPAVKISNVRRAEEQPQKEIWERVKESAESPPEDAV